MPHLLRALLGHFQATLDGQPVTGCKSKRIRALLAYRTVEGGRKNDSSD